MEPFLLAALKIFGYIALGWVIFMIVGFALLGIIFLGIVDGMIGHWFGSSEKTNKKRWW